MLYVERYLQEHGPFDGIVGFSQGAALTSAVIARQQEKAHAAHHRVRFSLLFSGVRVPSPGWPPLLAKQSQEGVLTMPSLHVYDSEESFEHECRHLHQCYDSKSSAIIHHSEGHKVPSDPHVCEQIATYLHTMMAET